MKIIQNIQYYLFKATNYVGEGALSILLYEKSKGVTKEKNLQYLGKKRSTALDFYYLNNTKTDKKPVFIYIHGGGFLSGTKTARQYYCYRWVKQGYFAVNINYEFGRKHPFPTFLQQVFKGIEFAIDCKDEYNLDLDKIVIAGESAGAYISSFVSAITTKKELYEKFDIDFKYKDTFKIKCNVLMSGIYDIDNILDLKFPNMTCCLMAFTGKSAKESIEMTQSPLAKELSPTTYIDENYPPTAVIMSSKDALTPNSLVLCDKLKSKNVKYIEYTCTGVSSVHAGALCPKTKSGNEALKQAQEFALQSLSK